MFKCDFCGEPLVAIGHENLLTRLTCALDNKDKPEAHTEFRIYDPIKKFLRITKENLF